MTVYRALYWCWIVNEPVILVYRGEYPYCRLCNWLDVKKGEPSEGFMREHKFMQEISIPLERDTK